eukprot:5161245-Amphidinium_carterae.1
MSEASYGCHQSSGIGTMQVVGCLLQTTAKLSAVLDRLQDTFTCGFTGFLQTVEGVSVSSHGFGLLDELGSLCCPGENGAPALHA